jgi:cell division protease FtsH
MSSDPTNGNTPPTGKPPRRRPGQPGGAGGTLLLGLIIFIVIGLLLFNAFAAGSVEWGEFYRLLASPEDSKNIKNVTLRASDAIEVEVTDPKKLPESIQKKIGRGNKFVVLRPHTVEDTGVIQKLQKLSADNPDFHLVQEQDSSGWLGPVVVMLLPAVIILALFLVLLPRFRDPLGGGFLNNYVKSPAKRYERNKTRITFDDVAGMQNAKSELQEVVEFLRSPEKFQRLGAMIPKGVLLIGPPGTGKTLLARAVAGEAGVPFFSISGSEFIQMFVGVGASRVRDLFKTAKENSPCIIFIDEIDAVGRMRGAGVGGGSDEREQTLNQILSEMDGFQPNETVIVIAATNRPDVLDSALLRPGRFDRHVTVDRPTWQGRLAILKVHTRNKPLADDVDLERVARNMIGMTGADLRNLANEAALLATREGKSRIEQRDFERAVDRVLRGPKREEILTLDGKRRTAYHEVGHALVSLLDPAADPPSKVSIIPRGRSLGVTFSMPDEDRFNYTTDWCKARLAVMMGGRAADRMIDGQADSGQADDLKQATRLARLMVTHWGMSSRLGPMAFRQGEEHVFLGKEIQEPRDYSEGMAQIIDEEVQKLLREADERAYNLLMANRDKMDRLVEALLQREELSREEIEQITGVHRKDNDGSVNGVVIAPGVTGITPTT